MKVGFIIPFFYYCRHSRVNSSLIAYPVVPI